MPAHFLQLGDPTGHKRGALSEQDERDELHAGDYVRTSDGECWQVMGTQPMKHHPGSTKSIYVCTHADERMCEQYARPVPSDRVGESAEVEFLEEELTEER